MKVSSLYEPEELISRFTYPYHDSFGPVASIAQLGSATTGSVTRTHTYTGNRRIAALLTRSHAFMSLFRCMRITSIVKSSIIFSHGQGIVKIYFSILPRHNEHISQEMLRMSPCSVTLTTV